MGKHCRDFKNEEIEKCKSNKLAKEDEHCFTRMFVFLKKKQKGDSFRMNVKSRPANCEKK